MAVRLDTTGQEVQALPVDDASCRGRRAVTHPGDPTILYADPTGEDTVARHDLAPSEKKLKV
jgi:hypothetical protein